MEYFLLIWEIRTHLVLEGAVQSLLAVSLIALFQDGGALLQQRQPHPLSGAFFFHERLPVTTPVPHDILRQLKFPVAVNDDSISALFARFRLTAVIFPAIGLVYVYGYNVFGFVSVISAITGDLGVVFILAASPIPRLGRHFKSSQFDIESITKSVALHMLGGGVFRVVWVDIL